jgi:Bardet-Biedl syndrome 2 protein
MLSTAFTIKLDQPILQGLVAVGKFDGQKPSLACATTGGKILLHSPHQRDDEAGAEGMSQQVKYLNFNRKITALAAGGLNRSVVSQQDFFHRVLCYVVSHRSSIVYHQYIYIYIYDA